MFAADSTKAARDAFRPYYAKNAGPDAWDFDEYADKTPMTVGAVDEILGNEIVPRLRIEFDKLRADGVPSDPPKGLPVA